MSKPTASTMSDSSAIDAARRAEREALLRKMQTAAAKAYKTCSPDVLVNLPAVNALTCKYLDRLEEVTINPKDEQGRGHNRTGFAQTQPQERVRPEFQGKTIPPLEWVVRKNFPELVAKAGDALTLVRAASSLGGFTVDFPRTMQGKNGPFESVWVTRSRTRGDRDFKEEDLVEGFV